MRPRTIGLPALLGALGLGTPVQPAVAGELQLEEVRVTAQHREESLQATPISLFTFNREQLEKQRISSIARLGNLVPNLDIDAFPANSQTLRLFIRGVGLTDTQLTQDAAVGVYLNGAYIARATGLTFDLADLARIEVLRGPQGTLYGRNTTGGAIRLITSEPDLETLRFEQTLGSGNHTRYRSRTSLNLPLGGRIAARAAYFHEQRDGFTTNGGGGGDWGDRKSRGLRLDLRADWTDRLSMGYAFDRSKVRAYNLPAQAITPREPTGADLLSIVGAIVQDYVPYSSDRLGTLDTATELLPTDTAIQGHTLTANWHLGDAATLRSISAWRELDDSSYLDFSSGSSGEFRTNYGAAVIGAHAGDARLDLPATRPHLEQKQWSQEFQLLGDIGGSLQYLAGLYCFHEEAEEDAPLHHVFSAFPFGGGTLYNINAEYNRIENDALAFFTQWTWTPGAFERRLHLTLGWRHSEDSREAQRRVTDRTLIDRDEFLVPVLRSSFAAQPANDYDDDSYTAIAAYDWSDDLNLYAKYAEAYKSGGFNIRDPDEDSFNRGFEEEKLRSVELGAKGESPGRRLRFSAALFHQRFDDFQYNFQIPGTIAGTRVFNIDEGEMTGLELEVTAMPARGLFLQLSYAYLDSKLDDVANPFTGELQRFEFTNAPEHTYSLVADYNFRPLPFGRVNLNASYSYTDDRQAHSATLYRASYGIVNARLALEEVQALDGVFTLAAWGRNLTDKDYAAFTLDNLPQASRAVIWGDGRSYGLEISYRYGR